MSLTISNFDDYGVRAVVFNATFNNISVISWRSVLLMEETGYLYHIQLSSTPRDSNSQP